MRPTRWPASLHCLNPSQMSFRTTWRACGSWRSLMLSTRATGQVERLLMLESQISPQPFRWFTELVREGIADGSLRSDLDPDLTLHAVINAVIGTQRRLASFGKQGRVGVRTTNRPPVPRRPFAYFWPDCARLTSLRAAFQQDRQKAPQKRHTQEHYRKEVLMKLLAPVPHPDRVRRHADILHAGRNTRREGRFTQTGTLG